MSGVESRLQAELGRVRAHYDARQGKATRRLGEWIEEHPDASLDDAQATEEYRAVLRLADRELNDMALVLGEVLPAVVQEELRS